MNRPVFPPGFFDRADDTDDARFYALDRFVTHVDDAALARITARHAALDVTGDVLDLCSSWITPLAERPARLVALGMNAAELEANELAHEVVVHDLNADPALPFDDASFDDVICVVSVDYLVRPLEVFAEVARVLRPGGAFTCSFSNRCFPTKAIAGWLRTDDRGRCAIVAAYFDATDGFDEPVAEHLDPAAPGDPVFVVRADRAVSAADATATVEGSPERPGGTVEP